MVADVGHSRAQNKPETWHRANDQAWQWLQSNINGSHDQTTTVTSEPTLCANSPQPASDVAAAMSLTATSPEALSSGALTIAFGHGGTTTEDSGSADPDGPATDPVVSGAVDTAVTGEACRQSTGSADPSGRYTAVSDPLPHHVTYVGLGFVQVPYRLTGTTATLHARVWDVPPGGGPTLLITRGTYRIDAPAYDRDAGVIRLPLFGNHWPLEPGHRIRLDLLQDEAPYLRRSNVPSTLSFDPPSLRLPTREAGELALSGP
jgi:predicted acyl esterase